MADTTDTVETLPVQPGSIVAPKSIGTIRRNLGLIVIAVALIAMGVATSVYVSHWRAHQAIVRRQKILQSNIGNANAVGNLGTLKRDSNALIAGARSGQYKLSDVQLAQAYLNRGDVAYSSGDNRAAVADYAKAVALQPSMQLMVGNNEFLARYHLGERKTLIPLLHRLEKPLMHNYEPGVQELLEQYQAYVVNLQAGEDLSV
jgi:tetratricopeptide (TPR) repeat protein